MNGRFDESGFLADLARGPIRLSQSIQNGASYFTFGVSVELNVKGRIEVIDGSHEADYASGDEIVETDVTRQPVVNPPGNQPDLRTALQHERLPSYVSLDD